jgi:RimJ/RimL family protein N-acetyltransferase
MIANIAASRRPALRWRPARPPQRVALRGRWVRLEPLEPRVHGTALYAATHDSGHDSRLWDFMFVGPFVSRQDFAGWLAACRRCEDPLFFAIVDRNHGPLGLASFTHINPGHGVIELGNIFFAAPLQRTRAATEAIYLMLRHAFDQLGYRRVEWKCDSRNLRSRRAALRFGFRCEGLFRQHMVVKGESRDTMWFAIIDREWPRLRQAYRRWLDPANFDAAGHQRRPLKARQREYSPPRPAPRR